MKENMHWKDRWEHESGKELDVFLKLSQKELLERIENGKLGFYMNIWRAIARKGSLKNSWEVLWNFLKDHPGETNMINRYHCANALFILMKMPDPASETDLRRGIQWDHEGEDVRLKALDDLKKSVLQLVASS